MDIEQGGPLCNAPPDERTDGKGTLLPLPETRRQIGEGNKRMNTADRLYEELKEIPTFKNLSMDRQGEVIVEFARVVDMLTTKGERTNEKNNLPRN